MQKKVKEGAAAIYTVVFFCLLIGIVTLGFVGIMLQDILGSTNYDLSQSAYDSALAGVEDAKVLLLQYNSCITNTNRLGNCESIKSKINKVGSSDDCDLVRDALGRAGGEDGDHETLIQSDNKNTVNNSSKELDDSIDMAYTCVKMSLATEDYLGTITESSDLKVIPLRTGGNGYGDGGAAESFNRIRIEWFNKEDNNKANGVSSYVTSLPQASFTNAKTLMGYPSGDSSNEKWHNFDTNSTLPPTLRVSLIQADSSFKMSDFNQPDIDGSDVKTNHGTVTLRPTGGSSGETTHITSSIWDGLGGSALSDFENYDNSNYGTDGSTYKTLNSPRDISCLNAENFRVDTDNEYACSVELDVPLTYNGGVADNGARFLMLSTLYAKPETSFKIQLLNCINDDYCPTVKFVGVQTKVDSTGRANDLFRRVEARVELQDVNFPFVKYGLSSYGDGDDNGNIFKNYWATYNCWYKEAGVGNTCDDFGIISSRGSF